MALPGSWLPLSFLSYSSFLMGQTLQVQSLSLHSFSGADRVRSGENQPAVDSLAMSSATTAAPVRGLSSTALSHWAPPLSRLRSGTRLAWRRYRAITSAQAGLGVYWGAGVLGSQGVPLEGVEEEEARRKLSREFPEWDRAATMAQGRRHEYSKLQTV